MKKIYSPLNPAALFMIQRRHREIRRILESSLGNSTDYNLSNVKLLEIGCGNGQWLAEFQTFGMNVANLAGIEIDEARAESATKRIIGSDIKCGTAAELPWEDNSFDIVFQSTVFTSILDDDIKKAVASEMRRVCKDDGFILWYDFAFDSPSNSNVKGVGKSEIRNLFDPWSCDIRKITLAPPIARRVVPVSWMLAEQLETFLPFFRTHLIAEITPNK